MDNPGFSKPRLEKMRQLLSVYVEEHQVPGMVTLLSRNDEVHVETLGTFALGDTTPLQRDTIFRIASLTKMVAAVAAMQLVEDCKIRLDDSIEPWLPELANRQVLKDLNSELDETVPAKRAITLRDLLTFRMGFGSILAMPDTYPIQKFIRQYEIGGDQPQLPTQFPATDEWLKNFGTLPLLAQPGERWMYQVSADVLGALIARVTGQSLGRYLHDRIFKPLGMNDTAFYVPPEKAQRLPALYYYNQEAAKLDFFDDPNKSAWLAKPAFESASSGLVSTIEDFFIFCRMLLDKGRHGSTEIISRASVEMMTTDQLLPGHREGAEVFLGDASSWGFGMAVDIKRTQLYQSPGRFGWEGGFGTSAHIDPAENMIGMFFTQLMFDSPVQQKLYEDFWTLAYSALL